MLNLGLIIIWLDSILSHFKRTIFHWQLMMNERIIKISYRGILYEMANEIKAIITPEKGKE